MSPAKEAVVSLSQEASGKPHLSQALATGTAEDRMDKGWAGFQGNGILGISHPPKRKEQIMQILGTNPLATSSDSP